MSSRSDARAVLLAFVLVLTVAPTTVLAQGDLPPADSVLPDLAPVDPALTSAEICELAQGALDEVDLCRLPDRALDRAEVADVFGRVLKGSVLSAATPAITLDAESTQAGRIVDSITFVDDVRVNAKARKALNRVGKRKGRSTVSGKKAKWKNAGIIDIALHPGVDGTDPFAGDWLVRLTSGSLVRDFGVVDGKDYVADATGQRQAGIALLDDDAVTLMIPGGVRQAFTLDIVRVEEDGSVSGQHLGGPGSANARIPVEGAFSPVVECLDYFATIDFDSSTNGTNYDLLGLDFVIDTTVLPDFVAPEDVVLDLTLAPRGSRAKTAKKVELEGVIASGVVRQAIAFEVDLSQPALQGQDGYWLTERPFDITRLDMNLDAAAIELFDRDLAVELLNDAGWLGPDENGDFTRASPDVVAEVQRQAGGAHTSRPLFYADAACATDPHFESVVDVCQEPTGDAIDIWEKTLGEDVDEVRLQPGLFPGDLYGCTVLGAGDQLVSAFAVSGVHGQEEAFDPSWLDWSAQLDCIIDDELPLANSPTASRVADCETSMYEIWADYGIGAWAYALLVGSEIDPVNASEFILSFAALDLDADGIPDRHDGDLDGDGRPDIDDLDDDADGADDVFDFSVRSDETYLSPGVLADLGQMAELLQTDR